MITKSTQAVAHLFLARVMFAFPIVYSMTAPAVPTVVLFHQTALVLIVCSLKTQHSLHARQQASTEEQFSTKTRIVVNALFCIHVVLTALQSVQTAAIHGDSMLAYKQSIIMPHTRMKLMNLR